MMDLNLNEMEQVSGGVEGIQEIRVTTEVDIRQAAIAWKNQGHDKETVLSLLNSQFPGMKSTVQRIVDALF